MAETVFLDACVLFPRVVRSLIEGAVEQHLFRPACSERVLEEWRIAAAREGMAAEDTTRQAISAIRALPGMVIARPEPATEAEISLPDPADAHVLACAIAAGAGTLLSFNLRDFPTRRLARFGITPRHPDSFFWELLSHERDAMRAILDRLTEDAGAPGADGRKLLKRAHLPRLGKAWAEGRDR